MGMLMAFYQQPMGFVHGICYKRKVVTSHLTQEKWYTFHPVNIAMVYMVHGNRWFTAKKTWRFPSLCQFTRGHSIPKLPKHGGWCIDAKWIQVYNWCGKLNWTTPKFAALGPNNTTGMAKLQRTTPSQRSVEAIQEKQDTTNNKQLLDDLTWKTVLYITVLSCSTHGGSRSTRMPRQMSFWIASRFRPGDPHLWTGYRTSRWRPTTPRASYWRSG